MVISYYHYKLLKLLFGFRWLEFVEQSNLHDISDDFNLSWAAYHASRQSDEVQTFTPAITSLLLLFQDDSKSVAMIRHSMDVIRQAVHELNQGGMPTITLDQPLYAITKRIQWTWPEQYGEDQFIVILGGLHIEMAAIKVLR